MREEKKIWLNTLPKEERKELEEYFGNHEHYDIDELDLDLLKRIRKDFNNGNKDTANFRLHAKLTADNYHENGGWSSFELAMKEILESMGLKEDEDWYHGFKLHNEAGTGYFELDFLLPEWNLVIEVDSDLWHDYIDEVKEKDKRRDKWLGKLGFETLRFKGNSLNEDEVRSEVKERIQ